MVAKFIKTKQNKNRYFQSCNKLAGALEMRVNLGICMELCKCKPTPLNSEALEDHDMWAFAELISNTNFSFESMIKMVGIY